MKLMIISPFAYSPNSGHGGATYCLQQLCKLSEEHEIVFLSFQEDNLDLDLLRKTCSDVILVKQEAQGNNIFKKVLNILYFLPEAAIISNKMKLTIAEVEKSHTPDLVILQFPAMAPYVLNVKHSPTILDVQDVFSVSYFKRYLTQTTFSGKLLSLYRFISWWRLEKTYYNFFDEIVTLSEKDRYGLDIFGLYKKGLSSPLAINIPTLNTANKSDNTMNIGFLGWFGHPPNVDAVDYFINDIFPLVLNKIPRAKFIVGGKDAPNKLLDYGSKNIEFLGFLENLEDFYMSCDVVVLPLRFGGGVKIKLLEAMSFGCPIVSTPTGVEGLNESSRDHLLICNNNKEFSESVISVLSDDDLKEKLSKKSRRYASDNFSWDAKLRWFNTIFSSVYQNK